MSEAEGTLKQQCHARDANTCRLCGRHGRSKESEGVWLDAHHIRFRRGVADDVLWNLISLCRNCHDIVHGNKLLGKHEMQEILWELAQKPGITGFQLMRWKKTNKENV